jgi:hypothetical protein
VLARIYDFSSMAIATKLAGFSRTIPLRLPHCVGNARKVKKPGYPPICVRKFPVGF